MRGRKRLRIKRWKAQGYARADIRAFAHLGQRGQAFVLAALAELPWGPVLPHALEGGPW